MSTWQNDDSTLSVYDLDGVITRKDTFAALLLHRAARSPRAFARALPPLILWMLAGDRATRERYSRRITEAVLSGVTELEYAALASRLGTRIGADPRWIRLPIAERIAAQRAAGVRVVIATATERRLAEALLRRAGIEWDLLSASALAPSERGMRFADHRVGGRKAEALLQQGVPLERAEFVTDSMADLPTGRHSASVLLVGASKRTIGGFSAAGVDAAVRADLR